jgi:hypothetical protein
MYYKMKICAFITHEVTLITVTSNLCWRSVEVVWRWVESTVLAKEDHYGKSICQGSVYIYLTTFVTIKST